MARINYSGIRGGKPHVLRITRAIEPGLYEAYGTHYRYRVLEGADENGSGPRELIVVNPDTGFERKAGTIASTFGLDELDARARIQLELQPAPEPTSFTMTREQLETLLRSMAPVLTLKVGDELDHVAHRELLANIEVAKRVQAETGFVMFTSERLDKIARAVDPSI